MATNILTDQPEHSTDDSASADAGSSLVKARDMAIHHAAAEASSLAVVLGREVGSDEFPYVAKNALARIAALSDVVCLLNGQEREADIRDGYEVVFGKPVEVAHG